MAATLKTRSCDVRKRLLDCVYSEQAEYVQKSKLPTGQFILGRMLALCGDQVKGKQPISKEEASRIVAHEVVQDWIAKKVQPMTDNPWLRKLDITMTS